MIRTATPLLFLLLAACSSSTDPASELDAPHAGGQVLVQLADPEDGDEVDRILEDFAGHRIERIGQTSFFVLHLPMGADLGEILDGLDDDIRVLNSSPNYVGEAPEGGPRDLPTLGSDLIDDIALQAALAGLDLPAAHALTRGDGVVVAVVDTGIDFTHPFLAASLEPGGYDFIDGDGDPTDVRNFVDDDGDGLLDEQFGHGTFVASLVLSVAPDARILPVRALNDEGFGTTSTVAAGIVWAVDSGARIVNVSVDIPNAPDAVKEAIHYAEEREVVVVGAAGNGELNQVVFPARFSDVIGVAAVDAVGVAADFTNVGSMVSLVAPGIDMIGAFPLSESPSGTARWSGTSFAAPLVSGSAALVRSLFPSLTADKVIQKLEDTALSVDALNPTLAGRLGEGMVQPAAAVIP